MYVSFIINNKNNLCMKLNEYLLESLKKTTIDVQDAINIKCGQLDKNKFKLSNIQDFDNVFDFIVSDNCLLASPTDIKVLKIKLMKKKQIIQ